MTQPMIGFAGMTHLGLVSGVCAAEKGLQVVGFDPDSSRTAALARGELPVSEPQLPELLAKNKARLQFTSEAAALESCGVVYVAPDVPTDDEGGSDLRPINSLLDQVLGATRKDTVVVVLSQVPPGFTRSKQRPGRSLYYQVETLIFGRAVERALLPERYIVGCADPSQPLPGAFAAFLGAHGCPILPMRFESAELAKISINMCLVASVSTANTLAELCEKIGADWSEIVPALKLDKRIGQHAYLTPGLGLAGGNLERDLATVCNFADEHGTDAGVVRAWMANSAHRRHWPLTVLKRELLERTGAPVIAVWGLTYKADTHSTKNSPALELIRNLQGRKVRAHDPVAQLDSSQFGWIARCSTPLEAVDGADALVVMTPWRIYSEIDIKEARSRMRGRLILDPYQALDEAACRSAGITYRRLGC